MSEAKKEEMSGSSLPAWTLHMRRQGRFGEGGGGGGAGRVVSYLPGAGKKVPAVK